MYQFAVQKGGIFGKSDYYKNIFLLCDYRGTCTIYIYLLKWYQQFSPGGTDKL